MKKIIACLGLLFLSSFTIAQNTGSVKGKLIDSIGKQSLKDASITVLNTDDSTLEAFSLAVADGSFEVKNISYGNYILNIVFQGYETFRKNISLTKTAPVWNIGTVYMKLSENDLGDVVVSQSPIIVKNDTIEYNAGSFKTKPNAVVEDLLKKLPGMDVDKSGGVKAQGETVQRILVDGKRFFGDDPKMATKNLPPDIVDKIQVFDDLSDQSKFTGFDDGNRVKTINITTKKDKRKGYFGKGIAGVGSDGTYDESLNIHRMNGAQQISFIGQANNINKQNYGVQDFLGGGTGGGRGGSSGGSGITSTLAGGLNYRDSWGANTEVSGSYFYNSQRTETDQNSFTQNLLRKDSSTFNTRDRSSIRENNNHRINLNIEKKIDSSNSIIFRPNISFQHAVPHASSSTLTTMAANGQSINQSVNTTAGINSGYNISGTSFQFRHRFKKRGRTISLDMGFGAGSNNSEGNNYAINSFYYPATRVDTINQRYVSSSNSINVSPTISYTEPIGKNQVLELNYNYSYNHNNSINNTYRFNNTTHAYTSFDSLFSNSYKNTTTSSRTSLNYRFQKNQRFNFSIGTGLQFTDQHSINTTKKIDVKNRFTNFTPTANFQYNFSKTSNLRINYTGRTGQPSITQLQPLTTTSDSINFQVGNPDLRPQFTHNLRLLYHSFNPITQHVFLVTVNASTVVNDIQSSIVPTANGGRTTTYANLNGTYNLSGYINYGFPLRKPKSNLNLTANINFNQAQTLVNAQSNFTRNTTLGQTIKWTTNLKNNFDMNFSSTTTYNIVRNTFQSTQNANYYSENLSAEITAYTNNGWLISADFDYTYSGNRTAGYNTSVPLLNPSIAKQFLKNKTGELRLSVFDLFNQNVGVTRNTSDITIQDIRTNVLTRYAMLTFTYNLRQFGARPQQRRNSPGMNGRQQPANRGTERPAGGARQLGGGRGGRGE